MGLGQSNSFLIANDTSVIRACIFAKEDFTQVAKVFVSLDWSVFKGLHQGVINIKTLIVLFFSYRYIHKIFKLTICNTIFFYSGRGDGEVLVKLSLMEQVIKDASSMHISFRVKYPQIFWDSCTSLFNMFRTITDIH